MPGDMASLVSDAVLLRDDSMGVMLEQTPRKIQQIEDNQFRCSVNPDWLQKLDMDEQGQPTVHSFSLGVYPVVVQNPAIIIQSTDVMQDG